MTAPALNIQIRAMRAADWEANYLIREQPAVRYGILAVPFTDPDQFRERAAHNPEGNHRLVAELSLPDGSRLLVGQLGLHLGKLSQAHMASIGIHVHANYHGKGIGSALMAAMCDLADNWLNLHRLELEVYMDNEPAIGLYKKFGFEVEATLHRFAFRDGQYVDAYGMGRINPRHAQQAAS